MKRTRGTKPGSPSNGRPAPEAPRVLDVRFGVNPNSSSLGVDVTYLLFGGTGAVAVALVLSAWLRGWRHRPKVVGVPGEGGTNA